MILERFYCLTSVFWLFVGKLSYFDNETNRLSWLEWSDPRWEENSCLLRVNGEVINLALVALFKKILFRCTLELPLEESVISCAMNEISKCWIGLGVLYEGNFQLMKRLTNSSDSLMRWTVNWNGDIIVGKITRMWTGDCWMISIKFLHFLYFCVEVCWILVLRLFRVSFLPSPLITYTSVPD